MKFPFCGDDAAHSIFGPIKSLVVFLRCPALLFWISGSRPGVKGAQRLCAPLSASTGRGNDRLALPAVQTLTKARGRYQNITAFVYHNDTLGATPDPAKGAADPFGPFWRPPTATSKPTARHQALLKGPGNNGGRQSGLLKN